MVDVVRVEENMVASMVVVELKLVVVNVKLMVVADFELHSF